MRPPLQKVPRFAFALHAKDLDRPCENKHAMSPAMAISRPERDLEEALVTRLQDLKYEYRPDIRDRATLEANFREKFEALNRVTLTDGEFQRLLDEIVTPDVYEAARSLRNREAFIRDDGTPLNYTLVNIKDWCKNTFEIVNQLRINTNNSYHRYDVMIQINGDEANEIILLNSHDGTSSYQMLAGMFRFVCHNGLVCGDTTADIRVPHKGDVASQVIEGAYGVLEGFERVQNARDAMRTITLDEGEAEVFANSALALKYDDPAKSTPVTESQLLAPRRWDDRKNDLWAVFNRVQENLVKGGLNGRTANGRNQRTRPVQGIDQNLRLNRALWLLAEGMRQLKA